jgi:hypothetical protein
MSCKVDYCPLFFFQSVANKIGFTKGRGRDEKNS